MKIPEEYRSRVLRTVLIFMEIIVSVVVYIVVYTITGKGIPCIFRTVTGMLCPGCGMTHALSSISRGRFCEAMEYNALSVTLCPLLGIFCLIKACQYIRTGEEEFHTLDIFFLILCLVSCVRYFVCRNDLV